VASGPTSVIADIVAEKFSTMVRWMVLLYTEHADTCGDDAHGLRGVGRLNNRLAGAFLTYALKFYETVFVSSNPAFVDEKRAVPWVQEFECVIRCNCVEQ
jgi:hypothetical protein